ncbi:polysaccharide biosynthesis C-terminal domain-containing protein [Lutibacter sp. A80]|uniref:polysaccharide biosynthesis C-terminal domain-containing protein n=1 Tax=Lutibacter sp. A80 TaxID=2918453 RepID=UPI001F0541D1|nr:polysaccharide biosynthesis C-terminal domain-containing protein [Lutibacter sp. A80]UMB61937.1 polysaccharide biosynthesis C-terminal domain-containing protein [Lutibacter sp. A80]
MLSFISNFLNRSGSYVFIATVISRLLSFLASWIALQLIPSKELGAVIYAFQIISFIIPMAGMGLNQGLLRYGAQLKLNKEKNKLFIYTLKYGILVSIILIGLLIVGSFLIDFKLENTRFYLILLTTAITAHFVFGLIKIQFRLYKNNKLFSFIEVTYNLLLVFFVTLLSYYFNEFGYAISLIITPIITCLYFLSKINIKWNEKVNLKIINFSFWKYGFFASLSNVTTQLLFAIDILLIGSILNNLELVTAYKYISLIPFSFLFLSQVVITTDFVNFTEKIYKKEYIRKYILNYLKLFILISFTCFGFIYIFAHYILLFFNKEYIQFESTLLTLTFGVTGILILRGIFGNLLSSIGKASANFIITSIALLINILLNYILIPKYGILGAAITSAILMWFTGILSMLFFLYYYKSKS